MEPSARGAASIEPLLRQAVGEASLAAAGGQALDSVLRETEMVIAKIAERSQELAEHATWRALAGADAQTEARRAELGALRRELMDQATGLALRFEALLNGLEAAEAALPSPLSAQAGAVDGEVEDLRTMVSERGRLTFAGQPLESPDDILFGKAPAGMTEMPGEVPPKRPWWRRRPGAAA